MHEGTTKRLEEQRLKKKDLIEMSVVDFALWADGAAHPTSPADEGHKKLMLAKVSDAICEAVHAFQESSERETRALRLATWVLAAFTAALAAATIALVFATLRGG